MNSLEKLIADLQDTKKILKRQITWMIQNEMKYRHPDQNIQVMRFMVNSIQSAINRLEALKEEIEVQE